MIEKIEFEKMVDGIIDREDTTDTATISKEVDNALADKLNEIIDAVNKNTRRV